MHWSIEASQRFILAFGMKPDLQEVVQVRVRTRRVLGSVVLARILVGQASA
jgi:hypothetical protein